jgi:cyd operon protein YbgE
MYGKFARWISLISASALALIITFYPPALSHNGTMPSHGLLALVMLGICAGFVHGIGFMPRSAFWRAVFHPLAAWVLMALGLGLLLA